VAENRDHFRRLNFIQKLRDSIRQPFWFDKGLTDDRNVHMTEKPEVR
jgi:hypothetical protein